MISTITAMFCGRDGDLEARWLADIAARQDEEDAADRASVEFSADEAAWLDGPCDWCQVSGGSLEISGGEALCVGCIHVDDDEDEVAR